MHITKPFRSSVTTARLHSTASTRRTERRESRQRALLLLVKSGDGVVLALLYLWTVQVGADTS